ncbi:superoxide dismutase [Bacillus sp. F19]|nr:superoxide dismutase [Bacillus sp. F19]
MSEDYIVLMKKWCENMLECFNQSLEEIRKHVDHQDLEVWLQQISQFKEELSTGSFEDSEIYERANSLYVKIAPYFELDSENEQTRIQNESAAAVPIGGHTLPPLPYKYDALEPYIDQEIMKLHHDKHHKSYVDGLNKAEKEMQKARSSNNYDLIKHWEREAAFHGAGHYLHTIFWSIMSPKGGGKPAGKLMKEINHTFGTFEKFKRHFSEAADKVEAAGWAILVWSPRARRLEILQAEKHQNLSQWDVVPILVLDVWEHAYYLQYKNDRKKYIENWWNVVNWQEAEGRFQAAQQLKWKPF